MYIIPIFILIGVVYLAGCLWTIGAAFADAEAFNKSLSSLPRDTYRTDLSWAVFMGFVPIFWVGALLYTGFYQHGWMPFWRRPGGHKHV